MTDLESELESDSASDTEYDESECELEFGATDESDSKPGSKSKCFWLMPTGSSEDGLKVRNMRRFL